MPTWLALVMLLSVVGTLCLMLAAVPALWSRQLSLRSGGRALRGPLAQLCGLLMLAPLPLALLSGGDLAYQLGFRQRPEQTTGKGLVIDPESEDPWKQVRSTGRQWLYGVACDFALIGILFDILVLALLNLCGRRARGVVKSK